MGNILKERDPFYEFEERLGENFAVENNTRLFQDIPDPVVPDGGEGEGVSASLVWEIYFADGSGVTLSPADVFDDYNPSTHSNWSIELEVSGTAFTKTVSYVSDSSLFDTDPQTFYRLPVVRSDNVVSAGGSFRETIVCVNGEPIVQLVKIS